MVRIRGIGIDIVEISKVREIVINYPNKLNLIFTHEELVFCRHNRFGRFSAIFTSKEATLKALHTNWERGRDLLDIEIVPLNNSQFYVNLYNRLRERAQELLIKEMRGAFSFSRDIAIAHVLALSS